MIRTSLVAVLLLIAGAAQARQADELDAGMEFEIAEVSSWRPFAEALLRGDRVTGLPAARGDVERIRLRTRIGMLWQGDGTWSAAVAAKAAMGTGANKDSLINNDIEPTDGIDLDQAWIRWQAGEHLALQLGKAPLPLALTPLLWDDDLRPAGVSLLSQGSAREFDRWQLDIGVFAPDPLQHTDSRLAAAQFGWHWREGAPLSAGVLLSYLQFDRIDPLARAGLGRGNSLVAGRYAFDYRLLDLQIYLRRAVGDKPLEARLDLVRNIDPDDDNRGARASLVYGDRFNHQGWEFGWSWQRMQRNAVLAAMTSDDWWFHTAARGHMPWIGYGFNPTWSLRLAAFFETRDVLGDSTERLLLDLEARW